MGYSVESHEFMTEDGYFLTYHRIPNGRVHNVNFTRPPVLVQHGLLCASPVWAEVNDSIGTLRKPCEVNICSLEYVLEIW